MMISLLLFACLDTTTKYLAVRYDVPFILAVRYTVNCLLMVALLAPRHGTKLVTTNRLNLVLIRAVCLAAASLFIALALQRMPVAETTAVNFMAPMLVVLLAGPLLREQTGPAAWCAAVAGFAGVMMIVRPGSGLDTLGVVFALCAVGANASYQLLSRMLADTERTITLLFYTALVGSICFGLALPWFWEGRSPSSWEILLFLSLGIYGGLGHFLFTAAYRYAAASIVAPLSYLQLVWAGLLGWVVFGHVPDGLTLVGMCVIAASGLLIAVKSRPVSGHPPSRAIPGRQRAESGV